MIFVAGTKVRLAKRMMGLLRRTPGRKQFADCQFFRPSNLKNASAEQISAARYEAAEDRRKVEIEDRFVEQFFGDDVRANFKNQRVLDFGCYFGGTTIAWEQLYSPKSICGFDVDPIYTDGANDYAKAVGSAATFTAAFGEALPYPNASFDTIISADVFEHVRDLEKCLAECHRVLAPGGKLLMIFPPYFHPYEHHLKVSLTPGVHWLFSGETCRRAQNEILSEMGPEFDHYKADAIPGYRLPSLNGVTVRSAKRAVRNGSWIIERDVRIGFPQVGRRAKTPIMRLIKSITTPLSAIPILDEVFLDRIAMILRKPA